MKKAATVSGDQSWIVMEVYTEEPGLQFYGGNFMLGKNIFKGGAKDDFRTAFCLETQHFPDAPNQPGFPSTVLNPGERIEQPAFIVLKLFRNSILIGCRSPAVPLSGSRKFGMQFRTYMLSPLANKENNDQVAAGDNIEIRSCKLRIAGVPDLYALAFCEKENNNEGRRRRQHINTKLQASYSHKISCNLRIVVNKITGFE